MVGVFNTIGHETEGMSGEAAAGLMEAMATIYSMLGYLERRDLVAAEERRTEALTRLRVSTRAFRQVQDVAGKYELKTFRDDYPKWGELRNLYALLAQYGYPGVRTNDDLATVAVAETVSLASVLNETIFTGTAADWHTFASVSEASNRLVSVGVITSRISALHGNQGADLP